MLRKDTTPFLGSESRLTTGRPSGELVGLGFVLEGPFPKCPSLRCLGVPFLVLLDGVPFPRIPHPLFGYFSTVNSSERDASVPFELLRHFEENPRLRLSRKPDSRPLGNSPPPSPTECPHESLLNGRGKAHTRLRDGALYCASGIPSGYGTTTRTMTRGRKGPDGL